MTYDRLMAIEIFKIYPHIGDKERLEVVPGITVKMDSLRLLTFKKSLICEKCGLIGSYFAVERHKYGNTATYHLNLYAYTWEGEVLMTKDHIIPKSKGGRDTLDNMQTLCIRCNQEKGDGVNDVIPKPKMLTNRDRG